MHALRAARIASALLLSLTLTAGPGTHPTPQHPTYVYAPPQPHHTTHRAHPNQDQNQRVKSSAATPPLERGQRTSLRED